jgi:hypothetical protein
MIQLIRCTDTLLLEINKMKTGRDSVALSYALALKSDEPTDWGRVNEAIVNRWSMSALQYIKKRAWAIVEGRIDPMAKYQ